jgi:hypothetical protein
MERLIPLPSGADPSVWQCEHFRQFTLELTRLTVALGAGGCTVASCPQMKATDEWLYLCAAHKSVELRAFCSIRRDGGVLCSFLF